jgi:hypothetical protein
MEYYGDYMNIYSDRGKGILYGHCSPHFIRLAPATTQKLCIKYFYVIDSI